MAAPGLLRQTGPASYAVRSHARLHDITVNFLSTARLQLFHYLVPCMQMFISIIKAQGAILIL